MRDRRFGDRVAGAHARVQRRERVLEDHLQRGLVAGTQQHRLSAEQHLAIARRIQAAHDTAERRLAAARLADQPDDLARVHVEAHVVDRVHDLLVHRRAELRGEPLDRVEPLHEAFRDVADLECRGSAHALGCGVSRSTVRAAAAAAPGHSGTRRRAAGTQRHLAERCDERQSSAHGCTRAPAPFATVAKRAAGGQPQQRRRHAGDLPQALAARVVRGYRIEQAARVVVRRRIEHLGRPALPRRCARRTSPRRGRPVPAITARSCVIQISAVPASRTSCCISCRIWPLHRDVERGRRLVGNDQRRAIQQRDRDRNALAHAAGKLVRVLAQPLGGRRDAHARQALRCNARAPRARRHARARGSSRSSACRCAAPGSGSSSGPGRSSRCDCRAGRAALPDRRPPARGLRSARCRWRCARAGRSVP